MSIFFYRSVSHINIFNNLSVESLRSELEIAAKADALIWGVNHNPANITLNNFDEHVDFFKSVLNTKLEIVNSEIQIAKIVDFH